MPDPSVQMRPLDARPVDARPLDTRPITGTFARDFSGGAMIARNATMLVVEDSRYSCEVLRLYCRQLGIRLRRAADLGTAQAHLRLYRPDIVMVDLGLPDGRGEDLIAQITASGRKAALVIAISGDDGARGAALAAGADVFMDKPLPDLAEFRGFLVDHYPAPLPLALLPNRPFRPDADPMSLQDDLELAARGLAQEGGGPDMPFLTGFIAGVAATAGDAELCAAAGVPPSAASFRQLRDIVNERLRDIGAQM